MEQELRQRVRQVLNRTFSFSEPDSQDELRMGAPPEWDSLGHMQLIMEIENEFGLTFPDYVIAELVSESAITQAVAERTATQQPGPR